MIATDEDRLLAELIAAEREYDPRLVDLARQLSMASRIEPELIRAMRRDRLPASDADVEADLWFSPLVQARGPDAMVFLPAVADLLRRELAESGRKAERDASWAIISTCHAGHSPLIRLEELITYLAIADEPDVRARMEHELGRALHAVESSSAPDLARWAARVLPRLPEPARFSEPSRALTRAASQRLGVTRIRGAPAVDAAGGWVSPSSPSYVTVGLRLQADGLELSEPPDPDAPATIEASDHEEIVVDLRWPTVEGQSTRRETFKRGTRVLASVPVGPELVVSTEIGASRTIRPKLPRERPMAFLLGSKLYSVQKTAIDLGWSVATYEKTRAIELDAVFVDEQAADDLEHAKGLPWMIELVNSPVPTFLVSTATLSRVVTPVTWFEERMKLRQQRPDLGAPLERQVRKVLLELDLRRPGDWLANEKRSRPVHEGLGALPYDGGTAFRVWAPGADHVALSGDFNKWSAAHPMEAEDGGNWYLDVPGVHPGASYKYGITSSGTSALRNDPRARAVSLESSSIVVRAQPPQVPFTPARLNDLIVYQLHVGTFGTQVGTFGIPTAGAGTFDSVSNAMAYLRTLGVNAVQLLPVAETASDGSVGFDPSFPFAVRDKYGGPSGLRALVETAHKHRIAVLVDVVFDHVAADSGLWQFDGASGGGSYFASDWRADSPFGRRLDYGRPEVRQYIRDNALMWLEEYGVDGLHWSGTNWIRRSGRGQDLPDGWTLMQSVNREVLARFPGALLTSEGEGHGDQMIRDVASGGAGFGGDWDLGFASLIRRAVTFPDDASRDMDAVASAVNGASSQIPVGRRVIYTESYDVVADRHGGRLPEKIFPGKAESWYACQRASLAAALVFTSPGTPLLFHGQERMTSVPFRNRVPFEWRDTSVTAASLRLYEDLIQLRWGLPCLRGPHVNVFHVNHSNKVIAFHRWSDSGDSAVVVANFKNWRFEHYVIGLPFGGPWQVAFRMDRSRFDPNATSQSRTKIQGHPKPTHGMAFSGDIQLGEYELMVLTWVPEARPDAARLA